MKKWIWTSLILSLLSSLGHFYLSKRSYQLKAGEQAGQSWCHINDQVSCDPALSSPYAEIFGISISTFGLSFNLFLSTLILLFWFFGLSSYWKSLSFYLSEWIAFSSVLMGLLSLLAGLLCPVCLALYVFSFVVPVGLFFTFRSDLQRPWAFAKKAVREKSFYLFSGGIVLAALFFHASFMNHFDIKSHEQRLSWLFQDWLYEKAVEIPPEGAALKRKTKGSKMELVEFADFLCPFCKKTQAPLKAFLKNHPDVNFRFYTFPLDSSCNPSVDFIKSGLSCELSKALICAERQGKGWPAHDFIFENQEKFLKAERDKEQAESLFESLVQTVGLKAEEFSSCRKEAQVLALVKKSALAGQAAQIQGTPSYFINGKQLKQHSQKLLLLKKAYQHLHQK